MVTEGLCKYKQSYDPGSLRVRWPTDSSVNEMQERRPTIVSAALLYPMARSALPAGREINYRLL